MSETKKWGTITLYTTEYQNDALARVEILRDTVPVPELYNIRVEGFPSDWRVVAEAYSPEDHYTDRAGEPWLRGPDGVLRVLPRDKKICSFCGSDWSRFNEDIEAEPPCFCELGPQ